jgi:hypothetical protein
MEDGVPAEGLLSGEEGFIAWGKTPARTPMAEGSRYSARNKRIKARKIIL